MSQKLLEIVDTLYAALPQGNWDAYRAVIHPEFRVVESDALPYAGTFKGIEGFLQLIEKVFGMFSVFDAKAAAKSVGDDHVMVWVEIKMTGRRTNKTINTQLIEVFRFENDKLIEIRPFYFDTDLVRSIV